MFHCTLHCIEYCYFIIVILLQLGNVEVITRLPDLTKISLDLGGVEIALSSFLLDGAAGVAMGNMTVSYYYSIYIVIVYCLLLFIVV